MGTLISRPISDVEICVIGGAANIGKANKINKTSPTFSSINFNIVFPNFWQVSKVCKS